VVRAVAGRRDRGHRHGGRHGAGRAGYRRIGAGLGVPAATLRRLRCRAKAMRRDAMRQLGFVGELADPPLPGPAASPLRDGLNAVAACARAAITRFGLFRAPACLRPGRDTHHDQHGTIPGAHRVR
jgi:hypothetical protein